MTRTAYQSFSFRGLVIIAVLVMPAVSEVGASSSGFDFPLGPPEHVGYGVSGLGGLEFLEPYDYGGACGFTFHPGEDWNDDNTGFDFGADRDDAGDPVFAASDGTITYADFRSNSWGHIVLIRHEGQFTLPEGGQTNRVWSQYGHLATISNNPQTGLPWKNGDSIKRGKKLGLVGDYPSGSGNKFHLHFEVRKVDFLKAWSFPCRRPRAVVATQYTDPTDFINLNRPDADTLVQVKFDFTGQPEPWVVPSNVTSVTIDARGAQGGGNPNVGEPEGGKGGRVQTTLAVTPGETLVIYVGGRGGDLSSPNIAGLGGINGGGEGGIDNVDFNAPAGGGGGASDVRQGGDGLVNRVVVAGGGGGAECCTDGTYGGDGGGKIGMSGGTAGGSEPGGGGTQFTGGAGGAGCNGSGTSGSLGQGGMGGNGNRAGGGGGGGYYGGGGGGGCGLGSGGGGGSSYPAGTDTVHTRGYQLGAGQVVIAYD